MYKCLECGRKFKTTKAAERAINNGCPKCGGVDIDLDVELAKESKATGAIDVLDENFRYIN